MCNHHSCCNNWVQYPRDLVAQSPAAEVFDAGGDSWPPSEAGPKGDGVAMDSPSKRGLVFARHAAQTARSHGFDLRGLPHAQKPKGQTAQAAKTAVRRLGRERLSHRDSQTLPPTVRDRNQLSATAASQDIHLHPQPASAVVLRGRGADAAKPVGLVASHEAVRKPRTEAPLPSGTPAVPRDAGMDQPRNREPIG